MDALVSAHSLLRWLVLLGAVVALVVALVGWLGPGTPERTARQATLAYAVLLDLQVLLGIVMWISEKRWAGGGRQFQFEHPLMMLVALAVVHIVAARARREKNPYSAARMRTIGTGASLLLILLG